MSLQVVIILSKIINLKANHNQRQRCHSPSAVVIILSKIINLKANHNYGYRTLGQVLVVIILSNDNKSESKSQPHYVKWQHTNTAMDKVVI